MSVSLEKHKCILLVTVLMQDFFFYIFYIMSIVVMQLFRNQIQYIQIKFHTLALLS